MRPKTAWRLKGKPTISHNGLCVQETPKDLLLTAEKMALDLHVQGKWPWPFEREIGEYAQGKISLSMCFPYLTSGLVQTWETDPDRDGIPVGFA